MTTHQEYAWRKGEEDGARREREAILEMIHTRWQDAKILAAEHEANESYEWYDAEMGKAALLTELADAIRKRNET